MVKYKTLLSNLKGVYCTTCSFSKRLSAYPYQNTVFDRRCKLKANVLGKNPDILL